MTGPIARLLVHAIYLSYWDQKLNQDILEDLASRIYENEQAHHIIAGDFQGQIAHSAFGTALLEKGWLSLASLGGFPDTNFPPPGAGSARCLDDVLVSPNMCAFFLGVGVERVAGFSTHASLTGSFATTKAPSKARVVANPLSKAQLQERVQDPCLKNRDPWAETLETTNLGDMTAQTIYDIWLQDLSTWLDIPTGCIGFLRTKEVDTYTELQAPTKHRKRIVHNLLLKTQEWLKEVLAKLRKGKSE